MRPKKIKTSRNAPQTILESCEEQPDRAEGRGQSLSPAMARYFSRKLSGQPSNIPQTMFFENSGELALGISTEL
jgi:hypothetical protein